MSKPTDVSSILLICINYRSESETCELIANLDELEGAENLSVILVDNSANYVQATKFSDLKPKKMHLQIYNTPKNLGYFGGAQAAWDKFKAKNQRCPQWVIVCNTDLEIRDRTWLSQLQASSQSAAVLAPQIISTRTGCNQNPYLSIRPSSKKMRRYKMIFNTPGLCVAYQFASGLRQRFGAHKEAIDAGQAQAIYAPHGSFMIFHQSYFEAGCDFQYGSFLFGEEIYVGEQCREKNLPIVYFPDLVVYHREHVATGLFPNRKTRRFIAASSAYLADQYFGNLR